MCCARLHWVGQDGKSEGKIDLQQQACGCQASGVLVRQVEANTRPAPSPVEMCPQLPSQLKYLSVLRCPQLPYQLKPACFGGRRVVWGQCEVQTEEDVAELCVWPTIPNTTRAPHLRHTFHMRLLQVFEAAPQEARGAQAKRAAPDYFL
eukprot:189382-Chlamydomonas_euryale.AAC.4